MKLSTLIASIAFATLSFSSFAATLTNSDGSNLTAMCIAAAESDEAVEAKAEEFGFNEKDLNSFTCNGLTLKEFAKKYRASDQNEVVAVYTFEKNEDSRETELCVAAATSNDMYAKVKAELFKGKPIGLIECNGLPLEAFAKRYGNKGFKK